MKREKEEEEEREEEEEEEERGGGILNFFVSRFWNYYDSWRSLESLIKNGQERRVLELLPSFTTSELDFCSQESGQTALHCAVQRGSFRITRALLDAGVQPHPQDMYLATPLSRAINQNDERLVAELIRHDPPPLSLSQMISAICRSTQITRILFPVFLRPPFEIARPKYLRAFKLVLQRRCIERTRIFLTADLDIFQEEMYLALNFAVKWSTTQIVGLFFKRGLSVHGRPGMTPPLLVEYPNTEIVQFLIQSGANVNLPHRKSKSTLLLKRVLEYPGQIDIVRFLIENGANVNSGNQKGKRPLMYATVPVLIELINAGAKLDLVDRERNTALMHNTQRSNLRGIEVLLSHGADPNIQNNEGKTPLHVAAREERIDFCRLLCSHGASPLLLDKENASPIDLVPEGLPELKQFLEDNVSGAGIKPPKKEKREEE